VLYVSERNWACKAGKDYSIEGAGIIPL